MTLPVSSAILTLAASDAKHHSASPVLLALVVLSWIALLAWRGRWRAGGARAYGRRRLGAGARSDRIGWRQRLADMRPTGVRWTAFIPLAALTLVVVVLILT